MKYSYILVRFSDFDKLIPALNILSECTSVVEWHAVEGHVNLIMKLEGSSSSVPDAIKKIDGLDELLAYDIMEECRQQKPRNKDWSYAYLFIETERSKRDQTRQLLEGWDAVHRCAMTGGGCDFVVLIGGETISQLDTAVRERLNTADGILRVKRDDIINLNQI
jgi:DNA-binding Lrp family transcriptional regulator